MATWGMYALYYQPIKRPIHTALYRDNNKHTPCL